jgi:hypothetical protein
VSLLRRALDASVRPINLLAPTVGVVAGGALLAVGFPPLALAAGALSVATWGALVAWDIANAAPELLREGPPEPPRAPKLESIQLARAHGAILEAAGRVRRAVSSHEGVLSTSLLEIQAATDELVEAATGMATRGDALFRFLSEHDPSDLRRMAEEHQRSARGMRDPEVAASLRAAAEAKRRQLETLEELRTLYDRILAELLSVEAALGELHARVVKLTFDDPSHAVTTAHSVGGELAGVRQRVQLLERSAAATLRELSG